MFSMLYKPDRYLDELVTTFKPILDDHGKEIMNPWLYHFMDGYRTYFLRNLRRAQPQIMTDIIMQLHGCSVLVT